MDEFIWRGMTRAQLDAAYNNSAAVKNSAEKLADWTARSERMRAEKSELLDLIYGPRPRNRIDVFRCGTARAPLLVYIHGGYWQRNAKEFYACLAAGPMARGIDVALVGYTLAPEATLTQIVDEVRSAVRWLRHRGPRAGGGRRQGRGVGLVGGRAPHRNGAWRSGRRTGDQRCFRYRAVPA